MTGEQMANFASEESQRTEAMMRSAQAYNQPTQELEARQENLAALAAQAADLLDKGNTK